MIGDCKGVKGIGYGLFYGKVPSRYYSLKEQKKTKKNFNEGLGS
jgi:hypothetical protein